MHRFSRMHLSPEAALTSLATLDREEKSKVAEVVALIAVIDHRQDYLGAGHPSMCDYCVVRLHLSEDKAHRRIHVARAALSFPDLFECLADGRLSVTTASVLAPHLKPENAAELIAAAAYKSRQEILQLTSAASRSDVSEPSLALDGDVQTSSELVAPVHAGANTDEAKSLVQNESSPTTPRQPACERRGRIVTTGDGRREIRLVVTDEEFEVFRETQDLLGHAVPSGDPALVYARAMDLLRSQLKKKKFGAKSVAAAKGDEVAAAVRTVEFRGTAIESSRRIEELVRHDDVRAGVPS